MMIYLIVDKELIKIIIIIDLYVYISMHRVAYIELDLFFQFYYLSRYWKLEKWNSIEAKEALESRQASTECSFLHSHYWAAIYIKNCQNASKPIRRHIDRPFLLNDLLRAPASKRFLLFGQKLTLITKHLIKNNDAHIWDCVEFVNK